MKRILSPPEILLGSVLLASSCHHIPLQEPAWDPPPAPESLLAPFRPADPGELEILTLTPSTNVGDEDPREIRFRLRRGEPGGEAIEGELMIPAGASAASPAPLLQISPILGGALNDYLATRVFSGWAVERGFATFFLYQDERILDRSVDGARMVELLAQTTRDNISVIRHLVDRDEIDGSRIGCFGISLGAIKNVYLLAAMPEIVGGVLCLPGGNLAKVFEESREGLIADYFAARREAVGWSREEVLEDIRQGMTVDPLDVAPFIAPDRALLFLGSLDDKVPFRYGLELHRELGRPELHVLPLGHYTGMVAAPHAASLGFDWLHDRFTERVGRED